MSEMGTPEPITREQYLGDRHGKTFADVLSDPTSSFDAVLAFFNDEGRQQRMEDAEIHHDRAPLAGIVRELESDGMLGPAFATLDRRRSRRLRQAIGVLVRMIMERRGWRTTGKKGSLGVRSPSEPGAAEHNTGGLALWFIRAERYRRESGMPFRSTRERCRELEGGAGAAATTEARPQDGTPEARTGPQKEDQR